MVATNNLAKPDTSRQSGRLSLSGSIVRGALLLCLAGDVAANQELDGIVAKEPYTGAVHAQVIAPDRAPDAKKESGTATARFVPTDNGRSRFEVQANIRRKNDSGFVIEGGPDASGWSGRSKTLTIAIDRHGRISGGGVVDQHRITFGGQVNADRMGLTVETERLAKAAGESQPAGTRIVFDYDLKRSARNVAGTDAAPSAETASADEKSTKTCKRRVWKMRNVTTPGGGMTMIQVPHCLD
jgi:hypothetical protein